MGNNATFDGTAFNSDVLFDIDISPDKKAFTVRFGNLVVDLGKGTAPIVTRTCSFALKLSGSDPGSEIPLSISGIAESGGGANGHLLFSVNDQTMFVDFSESSGGSFVKTLNYKVCEATELRVTVFLWADRDSTSDAGANLTVDTIDSELNKAQR